MGTHRRINWLLTAVFLTLVVGTVALVMVLQESRTKPASDYLPKDVAYTPASSPLSTIPPQATLTSNAVSVTPPTNGVGPGTEIAGTANAADGTVYYRITDSRSGQIAAGQTQVQAGSPPTYRFTPQFTRPYTKGDPATLDVYVLDANGAEQTTRLSITLQ